MRSSDDVSWRRGSGRECSTCPRLIKEYLAGGKTAEWVLSSFEKTPEMRERHLEKVSEKEAADVDAKSRGLSRGAFTPRASGSKEVAFSKEEGLGLEEELGNFWPLDLYERLKEKDLGKAGPHDIAVILYKGQKLRGLVLEPCHGTAIGVIRVTNKTSFVVRSKTLLGQSTEGGEQ